MKTGNCPSQNSNTDPFSNNYTNCRYHEMSSVNPVSTPNSSVRIRKPIKIREDSRSPKYLRYSVPNATKSLDTSYAWPEDASEFPKNIYSKEPFAGSIDYWHSPRDQTWLYSYSADPEDGGFEYKGRSYGKFDYLGPMYRGDAPRKDRSIHTDTQSRFGYDLFLNEYGAGEQSRGYVEPPECHLCGDTPIGVAPLRFYDPHHLYASTSEFRKMNDPMKPIDMMIIPKAQCSK